MSGQTTKDASPYRREDMLDRLAMGASLLCLLHCLAFPLLIAALPSLSHILHLPESFHMWVVVFAIPCSLWALLPGRSRHGAVTPLLLAGAGLLFLIAGISILHDAGWETQATVAGSLLLSAAHVLNWRLRHKRGVGPTCADEIL